MVIKVFGKTTRFSKCTSNSVSQSAIISFNSNSIGFPRNMIVGFEGFYKTCPVVRINRVKCDAQLCNFFP